MSVPECEVLLPDALLLQPLGSDGVLLIQEGHEARHQMTDARLAIVQSTDKQVTNFSHQGSEQPKTVCFGML